MDILNLFYLEPDRDRWIKYDRYPRRIIRRIVRGERRPGGVQMVAINLLKGLDKLGIPYRYNDFGYAKKHPEETVCIIGKPHLLFERTWKNPIIFGAGVFSHPSDSPEIFTQYPNLKQILVPGDWMKDMFDQHYGGKTMVWPVGIDTDAWKPQKKTIEHQVLIYDKIRWEYEKYEEQLLAPMLKSLDENNVSYNYIKYGSYEPHELKQKVNTCASVIFLCEHETQGLAYQQILATNTPIFAWDRGGYWQDPSYFPHKAKYSPVSSVPYWDENCGMKFKDINEFYAQFNSFITRCKNNEFEPRGYVMENLTLEKCAAEYVRIVNEIMSKDVSAT